MSTGKISSCDWMTELHFCYLYCLLHWDISDKDQWPRGLRRRSAAARLLRSWVRIPPGACMFVVSAVCCQVEVSATSWSLAQRSPTDCGASLCVIYKPQAWEDHVPRWAAVPRGGGGPERIHVLPYTVSESHKHLFVNVFKESLLR